MATTDNKQNCRIGWMVDKWGAKVRITKDGSFISYETKNGEKGEYKRSMYYPTDKVVLKALSSIYPHHTLLSSLL